MELLLLLGVVAALVVVAASNQAKEAAPQSVTQLLDFAPFTLTQGEQVTVQVLAPANLAPEIVGQAVARWGLAGPRSITRVQQNLAIPSAATVGNMADLWQIDASYINPTATFTPKSLADALAPALATSTLTPAQRLATALNLSASSPLTITVVTLPVRKV